MFFITINFQSRHRLLLQIVLQDIIMGILDPVAFKPHPLRSCHLLAVLAQLTPKQWPLGRALFNMV